MNPIVRDVEYVSLFWTLQHPDFDGQELSLKLHQDGQLGKFEGSSGKYKSLCHDYIIRRSAIPMPTSPC